MHRQAFELPEQSTLPGVTKAFPQAFPSYMDFIPDVVKCIGDGWRDPR